ncbi:hypothetical protein F383_36762 [Gossypium arboreum]|uniref:Uncharacterized protein n=1 Tax=Gossypium arboreum TaxID=29729 RepID=A0A0B0M5U8_GOSAR|nr:hypothetical protein F383_36762 [Gossypium arboreum]
MSHLNAGLPVQAKSPVI